MSFAKITFWGGVGTVTGANFLVETEKSKFLVDCGLLQGVNGADGINRKDFPYDPSSINFLFLTHSHMDHIGLVPRLVNDGFRGVIYSTKETKELASIMFEDAIKVMSFRLKENKDLNQKEPLYSSLDAEKALSLWNTIEYHKEKDLGDFSVYLKDAGHILGSSMYEFSFKTENGQKRKVVFTGDSGNSPAPLLRDTEKIEDANYLIMDSVYGDRNHEDKDIRDKKFTDIVKESIDRGGTIIIPAFSIERTQVILYELNNMIEDGIIKSVPVYLDSPLALKVTGVYKKSENFFNDDIKKEISGGDDIFSFPKLNIIRSSFQSKQIEGEMNPKIIISGSGMSEGGRVVGHEMRFLPDPKNTIILMGYQAVGTLGRQIEEGNKEVSIKGVNVPVRAKVYSISGFSSHKDSDNLISMVSDTVKTLKKVFVVMGEPKSSLFLVQKLKDNLDIDAIYPERGRVYELD